MLIEEGPVGGVREKSESRVQRMYANVGEGEVSYGMGIQSSPCRTLQAIKKTLNFILGVMGNSRGALWRKGA